MELRLAEDIETKTEYWQIVAKKEEPKNVNMLLTENGDVELF